MRLALSALLILGACTTGGAPGAGPLGALTSSLHNPAMDGRRGPVEVQVKSAYPVILSEIAVGGGPELTRAMDLARIPAGDRPARLIQLQGDLPLYSSNPGALILALLIYGG